MKCFSAALCLLFLALLGQGCASAPEEVQQERRKSSPTAQLLAGDIAADEYLEAIRKANNDSQREEAMEMNRETERAFNVRTGRFEYVPRDTKQYWNPETGRWEFDPVPERAPADPENS